MKNILSKLEKIKEQLEEKVREREVTYDDRSEKWQESESGVFYQEKTDELDSVVDDVIAAIDSLQEWME